MCRILSILPGPEYSDKLDPAIRYLISMGLRALAAEGNYDGTGIAQLRENEVTHVKSQESAITWTRNTLFLNAIDTIDYSLPVITHVRKTSVGQTRDQDAQPFVQNGLALVHNGTITNHAAVAKDNKLSCGNTDSHMATQLFSKLSHLNVTTINSITSQLQGTFAFIMQKQNELDVLYAMRRMRDLYYVSVDDAFDIICTSSAIDRILDEAAEACASFTGSVPWMNWEVKKIEEGKILRVKYRDIKTLGELQFKTVTASTHYVDHSWPVRRLTAATNRSNPDAEILKTRITLSRDLAYVFQHIPSFLVDDIAMSFKIATSQEWAKAPLADVMAYTLFLKNAIRHDPDTLEEILQEHLNDSIRITRG